MDLTLASNEEIVSFLASRIRSERLRQGYTQANMAEKSGIPLRTYKRIELTGMGNIQNLIQILRVLGRIRAIEIILPSPPGKLHTNIVDRVKKIGEAATKNR